MNAPATRGPGASGADTAGPHDAAAARALLADGFGRVRQLVGQVTAGLSEELAAYRPDDQANSVAWLVWHLTRIEDDHVADAARTGQVWADGWSDRFGLPFDEADTGYGHRSEDVAAVRAEGRLLDGYHEQVHAATMRYVDSLTVPELERVVDRRWDPPVTVAVRLVSVLGDCLQHLGQAAYVRGMAERR